MTVLEQNVFCIHEKRRNLSENGVFSFVDILEWE